MALVFRPGIARGTTYYELPRPIPSLRIEDGWDFQRLKVPLAAGDTLAGQTADGVDIVIQGQLGSVAGAVTAGEAEMFAALEELRRQVRVTLNEPNYEFFVYHDPSTNTYRKFKRCSTVKFECDLSNVHLFGYTLVVHAGDPEMYATGPGG
jgi:hypothetical protein